MNAGVIRVIRGPFFFACLIGYLYAYTLGDDGAQDGAEGAFTPLGPPSNSTNGER
jgi:hypothetical protein